MNGFDRFNEQFRETSGERNERLREGRHKRQAESLKMLVRDLSTFLTDEGWDPTNDGLHSLRRRVANALPKGECPEWLDEFRDPPIVQS